jgi:predicted metal-binding membrane protein
MMIAMMVPSAAPAILLFSTISRRQDAAGRSSVRGTMFLAGYLAIWALFSVAATVLQWGLERLDAMAMDMSVGSRVLGGILLAGAGLYQFTPVKLACLNQCQNPILFFSSHWRAGAAGAFRMGAAHGIYCVGCCWFLMGLLFVAGIMNPLWIAGLSFYVALEKLTPGTPWLGRAAGAALMLGGILLIAASFT